MGYLIRKNVNGFFYYLGVGGRWEGLKSNAIVFDGWLNANNQMATILKYFENFKLDIIDEEIEGSNN